MQIGILTTSYPRHSGDWAGRFVADLAAALGDQGHQLEVLTPAPAVSEHAHINVLPLRSRPQLLGPSGIPQQLFGSHFVDRWRGRLAIPAFVAELCARCHLASRRWDRVISHWLVPGGISAAISARGLPHLAIAHSTDVHLLAKYPFGARQILRRLASSGATLVMSSEALRRELQQALGRGDTLSARDPRDTADRFLDSALVQRMGLRIPHELGEALPRPDGLTAGGAPGDTSARRLRVLFLGRLVPEKGVDDLLRAAVSRSWDLRVAGPGPERQALEDLATSLKLDMRFLGSLDEWAKWDALRWADVLAAPSVALMDGRCDSAAVVLLEAMAARAAVVTTDVGGNGELICSGTNGLLVKSRDPEALGDAILSLGEPTFRKRLVAAAHQTARAHDWSDVAKALMAHWGETVG